jgi:hypothetical protein
MSFTFGNNYNNFENKNKKVKTQPTENNFGFSSNLDFKGFGTNSFDFTCGNNNFGTTQPSFDFTNENKNPTITTQPSFDFTGNTSQNNNPSNSIITTQPSFDFTANTTQNLKKNTLHEEIEISCRSETIYLPKFIAEKYKFLREKLEKDNSKIEINGIDPISLQKEFDSKINVSDYLGYENTERHENYEKLYFEDLLETDVKNHTVNFNFAKVIPLITFNFIKEQNILFCYINRKIGLFQVVINDNNTVSVDFKGYKTNLEIGFDIDWMHLIIQFFYKFPLLLEDFFPSCYTT